MRHSSSEVFEHIVNGYAQSADTRLAAAFPRLDCDDAGIVYGCLNVGEKRDGSKHFEMVMPWSLIKFFACEVEEGGGQHQEHEDAEEVAGG
jgi:hypothetical protein